MRFKLLTAGALIAMSLTGITAAQAQDMVSCADFVKMDQQSQQSTLDQIMKAMPSDQATTSSSSSASTSGSNTESGDNMVGLAQVQDACQQNSGMTVNDAVSQIQDTGNSSSTTSN